MCNQLFKLFGLLLLTLFLFSYVVKSSDDNNEDYGDEDESYSNQDENHNNVTESYPNPTESYSNSTESYSNVTESIKNHNTTDEYDYETSDEDEEEDNDSCNKKSFIDKVKELHEEGRNSTVSKNVKHINETFDLLRSAQNTFGSLFGTDEKEKLKFFEFISEIDLGLSPPCMASFLRIISAVGDREIWGIKCKLTKFFWKQSMRSLKFFYLIRKSIIISIYNLIIR